MPHPAIETRTELANAVFPGDTIIIDGQPAAITSMHYYDLDGYEVGDHRRAWFVGIRARARGGESVTWPPARWDAEVTRILTNPHSPPAAAAHRHRQALGLIY